MIKDTELLKPRDRILHAAKALFSTQGYTTTSVRNIASIAKVDPALVIRHFGSKELLFLEAMTVADDTVHEDLGSDKSMLGENIVRFVFEDKSDIKYVYTELLRASGSSTVTDQIKAVLKIHFEDPVVRLLDGDNKAARASLVVAMMMGLMNSLWILKDEHLADLSVDQAVLIYGSAIQSIVE